MFVQPMSMKKGQKHIHSKAFKALEKKYQTFELAEQWIKKHHNELFSSSFNF